MSVNTETETVTFSLSEWETKRNEKFYAESESWHYMIGWVAAVVARGESLTAAQLEEILVGAEEFGNERLKRQGYPVLTAAVDYLRKLKAEWNS
jgi:hypothetical protein